MWNCENIWHSAAGFCTTLSVPCLRKMRRFLAKSPGFLGYIGNLGDFWLGLLLNLPKEGDLNQGQISNFAGLKRKQFVNGMVKFVKVKIYRNCRFLLTIFT